MADSSAKLMTPEEFFVWQQRQDDRYELVDGVPVVRSRASSLHDRITGNVLGALGNQLRDSPCWPATAAFALRTKIRSLRRADVLVTCDPPRPDIYEANEPKMVVEVLSPSNKGLPWQRKIEEYRAHPKLVYLLLIEWEAPAATLIRRDGKISTHEDFDGLEATIALPAIGCTLALAEIYRGIVFPEASA